MKVNWNQIDTVLLDMDGTLLDLHFDHHFWTEVVPHAYSVKEGIPPEEGKPYVLARLAQHKGTLNWYCLDFWTEELGIPIEEMKQDFKQEIREHPETIEFLAFLKNLNKQVIMVTNAHRGSLALKLEMTAIGPYFDHMISAHDFQLPKEDIRIWDAIYNIAHYNPRRTMLIDDNVFALKTAQQYGIRHLMHAAFVSPHMPLVDPEGFPSFTNYRELMP